MTLSVSLQSIRLQGLSDKPPSQAMNQNSHTWSEGTGRYRFLDLYRGIIVLCMLEGHVIRELLGADSKATYIFTLHEIFHGVTAPGFLFGAGFTFAIATQRRWTQSLTCTPGFFRRVWRATLLILVGYALHFPFLSLRKTLGEATSAQWNTFFLFDVLQCIGIGLLLMRLLLITVKREKLFLLFLTFLLFTIVYVTPLFWTAHIQQILPLIISSAVNGFTGSPFPLFPFMGFLLAGTCVSWLFLRAAQDGFEEIFMKWLMCAGALLVLVGFFLDILPVHTYKECLFWNTSPNYFWMRLGILFLMLSGLWFLEDSFASHSDSIAWMPKWLTILGVESFFVYIAHLLILCGWVTNAEFNLRWWWGGKLTVAESILVFTVLTLVMIPGSFLWRYLKKQHSILMAGIFWWMGFCVVWSFLFNPY
jgi:uncharacterized membrane protein